MYLSHYNLKDKPFQITTDPKFLWLGEKHQEALSTLKYGILENKGFLLLTGEVGTGKTVLINRLAGMVDVEAIIATIPDPDLESIDFFNFLSDGFNMKKKFERKGDFLLELRDFLYRSHDNNQTVVLIVDEAQRLSHHLLEEIRLLSNIELHNKKLINIFFVGQNEFHGTLVEERNKAVAQRITVRYNIEPLTETETGEYIRHRLKIAGTRKKIFKSSALSEIYSFSGGVPRLINVMCDHSLLTGYAIGKKAIDARIIKECAEELKIPAQKINDEERLRETLDSIRSEIAEGIRRGTIGEQNRIEPPPDKGEVNKTDAWPSDHPLRRRKTDKAVMPPEPPNRRRKTDKAVKPPEPSNRRRKTDKTAEPLAVPQKKIIKPVEPRPLWVRIGYVAVTVALIVAVGYFLKSYKPKEVSQFQLQDMTSQKYKKSLQQEGQTLKAELTGGKSSPQTDFNKRDPLADTRSVSGKTKKPQFPDSSPKGHLGGVKELMMSQQAALPASSPPKTRREGKNELAASEESERQPDFSVLRKIMAASGNKIIIPFGRDSNDIPGSAFGTLDQIAAFIVRYPGVILKIKGYTDARGAVGYNKRVSEFRATTIKSYLVGKGGNPMNIETYGLGPENPIATNETPEGRKANRRVELEFAKEDLEKLNAF